MCLKLFAGRKFSDLQIQDLSHHNFDFDTSTSMSSINSLRYIRDYLRANMIPNVLRPGGAELKPRGTISMAMAVSSQIFSSRDVFIFWR